MKKITNIMVMLMLMVSFASLAFADEEAGENHNGQYQNGIQNGLNETLDDNEKENPDTNETEEPDEDYLDNETEEEIEIMNNSLGAEIRLLQLEKAILKNFLKGERAVEVLKAMEFNTSTLESILAEMRLLLEEINKTDPSPHIIINKFSFLRSFLTMWMQETMAKIHRIKFSLAIKYVCIRPIFKIPR